MRNDSANRMKRTTHPPVLVRVIAACGASAVVLLAPGAAGALGPLPPPPPVAPPSGSGATPSVSVDAQIDGGLDVSSAVDVGPLAAAVEAVISSSGGAVSTGAGVDGAAGAGAGASVGSGSVEVVAEVEVAGQELAVGAVAGDGGLTVGVDTGAGAGVEVGAGGDGLGVDVGLGGDDPVIDLGVDLDGGSGTQPDPSEREKPSGVVPGVDPGAPVSPLEPPGLSFDGTVAGPGRADGPASDGTGSGVSSSSAKVAGDAQDTPEREAALLLASATARILSEGDDPGSGSVLAAIARIGGEVLPAALALVAVFALRRHVLSWFAPRLRATRHVPTA